MATIVRIKYRNREELFPIWSEAFYEEIEYLYRLNKDIQEIYIEIPNPDKQLCEEIDAKVKHTKYYLPKDYKEKRER